MAHNASENIFFQCTHWHRKKKHLHEKNQCNTTVKIYLIYFVHIAAVNLFIFMKESSAFGTRLLEDIFQSVKCVCSTLCLKYVVLWAIEVKS